MHPRVWGAWGLGSNSAFAECCSGLFRYSRQSGLPEVPLSADLEQELTARKVWGGGGGEGRAVLSSWRTLWFVSLRVDCVSLSFFRPGQFLKGSLKMGTKLSQPRGRRGYAVL